MRDHRLYIALALVATAGIGNAAPKHVAWHAARGHPEWAKTLAGIGELSPGVGPDGTIYVGAELNLTNGLIDGGRPIRKGEGNLFALKPSGKLKWTYHPESGVGSQPVIGTDGTVYFDEGESTTDNGMTIDRVWGALDALSPRGVRKWSVGGDMESFSAPTFSPNGVLYLWSGSAHSAYRPNGTRVWKVEKANVVDSAYTQVAMDRGRVYVADKSYLNSVTPNGMMKVVLSFANLVDGPITQPSSESDPVGTPMIGPDGTIYLMFAVGPNYGTGSELSQGQGSLWAFSPTGAYRRVASWEGERSGPLVAPGGTLLLYSTGDGAINKPGLFALHADGSPAWSLALSHDITNPVIARDGTIYVGSSDHFVYAISPNGKIKWKFKTGGKITAAPAVGPSGTVYVASEDGKLYAIR